MHIRLLLVLLALGTMMGTQALRAAEDAETIYMKVFNAIQEADKLNVSGQEAAAKAKYQQAQTNLLSLKRRFPEWNSRMVTYRMNYIAEKLTPKPAVEPASDAQDAKAGPGSSGGKDGVKLLSAGAEPRVQLRLAPKEGDQQKATLTLKLGMDMKMGEMQNPMMKLPPIVLPMDLTVKSVSPEGEIAYEMVMGEATAAEDPNANPEIANAMKSALAGAKGLSGSGVLTARGISKESQFNAPQGADQQSKQLVDQMKNFLTMVAQPLPDEPVGAGSKWQTRGPIDSQGIKLDQTATHELVSLKDGVAVIRTTFSQTAAKQQIENPAMPGLKVDLAKMTGKGTGERTQNLTQILPTSSKTQSHSEMAMAVNMGNQKQTITVVMDMNIDLQTK